MPFARAVTYAMPPCSATCRAEASPPVSPKSLGRSGSERSYTPRLSFPPTYSRLPSMFTQRPEPAAPPVTLIAFPKMFPVRNGTSPPQTQPPANRAIMMDVARRFTSTTNYQRKITHVPLALVRYHTSPTR